MTDIFVAFFTALGDLAKGLGVGGVFWAIASVLLLGFALKCFERACKLIDWLQGKWRRLPVWGKQVVAFIGAVFVWKAVWPTLPKTTVAVALGLGLVVFFWVSGAVHAHRYNLTDTTPWAAIAHHWNVTQAARKHTAALHDVTGKKGGKARKPRVASNGQEFVVEPEHGMSDAETADAYNDGKMNSALADRFGWDAVQDVVAEPAGDGTVKVSVLNAQTKDDFFNTSRPWPGMEKP